MPKRYFAYHKPVALIASCNHNPYSLIHHLQQAPCLPGYLDKDSRGLLILTMTVRCANASHTSTLRIKKSTGFSYKTIKPRVFVQMRSGISRRTHDAALCLRTSVSNSL